jgi:glycosyltransferase involved in cell wall biosynthesis
MRVCLAYAGGLVPSKGGGIASVISNIVKYASNKIDFSLLATYDKTELQEIQEIYPSTVKIEYVKPTEGVFAGFVRYLTKKVDDFDVLHFHDFPFGSKLPLVLRARLSGTNLVYSHHISLEELLHSKLALGYYYSSFNWFGRILKKVVASSQFIASNDLARFRNLQDKIHIIRNGVDVELIRKAKPIVLEGKPSFLFVGHLVYRKGIDSLLEAFRILSTHGIKADPKLHIIGSGVLEKNCREYVGRYGLGGSVRFWGSLPELMKFRMMKGADIIVVPSRYEPFGIVVLEGMAAGKPLIATRVGGIPEIIKQGINGILTYPSSNQIATAIKSLCERKELIEEYGRNNQKAVTLFDWKYVAQSYVKLYDSVISNYDVPRML